MSDIINNSKKQKQQALKNIINKLHKGIPVEKLQKDFADIIKNTSPTEIADMENALIEEGFPPEEIQRLCDVHAQVFEQSLKKAGKSSKIPGHPVYTFIQENREAKRILKKLIKAAKKIKKATPQAKDIQIFKDHFQQLKEFEKHFQRKENQLFPELEAKKFTGPTKVMWGKHDEIREMIRNIQKLIDKEQWSSLYKQIKSLSSAIKKLIFLEEKILYPTSMKKLNTKEWADIKQGGPEIGYAWVTPSNLWEAQLEKSLKTKGKNTEEMKTMKPKDKDTIKLSQGKLTTQQIDLLLKNVPFDLTFVDENDTVRYYSDTEDRIFPRSPAIIGRKVQNCHPPKSVHIVNKIVQNFKDKKKDHADFWIHLGDKFVYIRYFPVYDEDGNYKGVIEVSQEVSDIQKLEGERRLLDW